MFLSTMQDMISRFIFRRSAFLIFFCGLSVIANNDFSTLEKKLTSQENLNVLENISKDAKFGAVYNRHYINSLKGDEKVKALSELQKSRHLLTELSQIVLLLQKDVFSKDEKFQLLKQLTIIKTNVTSSSNMGSGNLILNNVLSTMQSALIFDLISEDRTLKKQIKSLHPFTRHIFGNTKNLNKMFKKACSYDLKKEYTSTYELIIAVAEKDKKFEELQKANPELSFFELFVRRMLVGKVPKLKTYREQLDKIYPLLLVWDIIGVEKMELAAQFALIDSFNDKSVNIFFEKTTPFEKQILKDTTNKAEKSKQLRFLKRDTKRFLKVKGKNILKYLSYKINRYTTNK